MVTGAEAEAISVGVISVGVISEVVFRASGVTSHLICLPFTF